MEQAVYRGKVVGVTFEPTKTNFKACLARFAEIGEAKVNPQLRLEADPKNPYDKDAVKVFMKNQGDDQEFHIGFLPGPKNGGFNKKCLEVGLDKLKVELEQCNMFEEKVVGFGIIVSKK